MNKNGITFPHEARAGTLWVAFIPQSAFALPQGYTTTKTLRGVQYQAGGDWSDTIALNAEGASAAVWRLPENQPFGIVRVALRSVYAGVADESDAEYHFLADGDVFVFNASADISSDQRDLAVLRFERGLRITDKGTTLSYSIAGRSVSSIPLEEIERVITRLESRINSQRGIREHRQF